MQIDMSNSDPFVLPFGKWRGREIKDVPHEYLRFVCAWNNSKSCQTTSRRSARKWMLKNCPIAIEVARHYVIQNKLCGECFKPLVPIGHDRKNGASHADWKTRKYHKRCWMDLPSDTESSDSSASSEANEECFTTVLNMTPQLFHNKI